MSDIIHEQRRKAFSTRDQKIKYTDGWLGILASFAVAWSMIQLLGFVVEMQYNADALSAMYQQRQVDYLLGTPFWVNAAQAASVAAGLVGAVFLLLRRKKSYYWFMLAIMMLLLSVVDAFLRDGFAIMGVSATGMTLGAVVVNIFIFWAAYSAHKDEQLPN